MFSEVNPAPAVVMITGSTGFVGRRLSRRLRDALPAGSRLVAAGHSGAPNQQGLSEIQIDLEDGASVAAAVAEVRPDLVIHLAARASVGQAIRTAGTTWAVNFGGSLALARAMATHTPDATLLYASSSEVYGGAFGDFPVSEDTVPEPLTAYARSKLAAEMMFADVLDSCKLIVARPSNQGGAGQDPRFVLPSFAEQIRAGAAEIHVGNLSAKRDFLHVDDAIDAYMSLIAAAPTLPERSVFNIASGIPRVISDLLDRLLELSGSQASVVVDPARLRPLDIPMACVDARRLSETTGWRPTRTLDQMLRDVLADAAVASA
ncbi:NAD-dependent epimerase/dehydratase family protein [Brevundimonas goettingensis]|nr:NAD-dependent epimerase/dehydratase family protein [Brevundimonas goettingensis]